MAYTYIIVQDLYVNDIWNLILINYNLIYNLI